MDINTLNIREKVVLAIEEASLLFRQEDELRLVADKDILVGVSPEKLRLALERIEDDYGVIEITNDPDLPSDTVGIFVNDYNHMDAWAKRIRNSEKDIVGEIKVWGKLEISIDRKWLRYNGYDRISVSLARKPMRVLLRLIDAKGEMVSSEELVKIADGSKNHLGASKKEKNENARYLKRDLGDYLLERHLDSVAVQEIKDMIESVHNEGYKLVK